MTEIPQWGNVLPAVGGGVWLVSLKAVISLQRVRRGQKVKHRRGLLGTALLVVGLTCSANTLLWKPPFPLMVWMHVVSSHLRQHLQKMDLLHKAGCEKKSGMLLLQIYLCYLIPGHRSAL